MKNPLKKDKPTKADPPPASAAPIGEDAAVTDRSTLAAKDADKLLAAGNEDSVVVMRATGDQTSVSIRGGRELKVDPKSKTIRTTIRHVPELRAHGFEVVDIAQEL